MFRIGRQTAINKGLNTFCYCSQANLIATGGKDKFIRMYNPLVLNKVIGKLHGHLFTIVDIACNERDQQLISLSAERVFRIWDLAALKCLQTFSDSENRPGEKRIFSIIFDQKRERLLTCSSVLDCWSVVHSYNETAQVPHSHDKPIVAICQSNDQVASVSADATLKVWNIDTGRLMYTIKEAHGHLVPVTCMASSQPNGSKLVTGGLDGKTKHFTCFVI